MDILNLCSFKNQVSQSSVKQANKNFDVTHTSCSMPGITPESFHKSLNIFELIFKVLVTDNSWITCYVAQYFLKFLKLCSTFIGSALHQIVAGRTVHATTLTVIFVLLTAITPTTFYILQTLGTKSTLWTAMIFKKATHTRLPHCSVLLQCNVSEFVTVR